MAFAAGVAVLQLSPTLPSPAWSGAALLLAVAAALVAGRGGGGFRGGVLPAVLLVLAAAIGGFAYAAWRAEIRLADSLPAAWEGVDIGVVGVVSELPRQFERGERFLFRVEAVETAGAHVPELILLSSYRGWHDEEWFDGQVPAAGERWRLTVRLKRPHGHANPGGFDYSVEPSLICK